MRAIRLSTIMLPRLQTSIRQVLSDLLKSEQDDSHFSLEHTKRFVYTFQILLFPHGLEDPGGLNGTLSSKETDGALQRVRRAHNLGGVVCRYRRADFRQHPGVIGQEYSDDRVEKLGIILHAFEKGFPLHDELGHVVLISRPRVAFPLSVLAVP